MSDSDRIVVEKAVSAAPAHLFALLADPKRHIDFDGSGLIRGVAEGGPIQGKGDVFVMDMDIDILGGPYQVRNTVNAYEPDSAIGWDPVLHPLDGYTDKIGTMKAQGHRFNWTLEPAGGGTKVTLAYDWSDVQDPQYRSMFPFLKQEQLLDSIERLNAAAG